MSHASGYGSKGRQLLIQRLANRVDNAVIVLIPEYDLLLSTKISEQARYRNITLACDLDH